MFYRELLLPPAARSTVFCAWQFELEAGDPPIVQHSIPPDGTTNFALVRTDQGEQLAVLVGPSLVAHQLPVMRGWRYCGLRLRPEAVRPLLGRVPSPGERDLLARGDRHEPVWRDLEGMLDGSEDWSGTIACFATAAAPDPAVSTAVDWIVASGGTAPLAQLARRAGLSERQFRRRFVNATGIAPKFYADVQRIRRALILALEDPNWAGVAAEAGYADQPHLVREVKGRFGAAPRQVGGYFRGMRHQLIAFDPVRFVQDAEAHAA
jgi:AraC-like DNA-binding protein